MKITDLTSRQKNFTKGLKNTCEYIVLHHTATGMNTTVGNIRTLLGETGRQVSAHFLVDTNGDIYKLGEPSQVLWHAGQSSWEGRTDLNRFSIGIEVIGPLPQGFTQEQKDSIKELVKNLSKEYGIDSKRIIRHKDIAPGRKNDIDDRLWNNEFSSFEEWKKSLFSNFITMTDLNSILKKEFPELVGTFTDTDNDKPATIGDVKNLVLIGIGRVTKKMGLKK